MVITLIFLPLFLNISARIIFPFLLRVASNLGKGQTSERSFLSILYSFKTLSDCPTCCLLNCNLPLIVLFFFAAHALRRFQDLSSVLRSPVHLFSKLSHCLCTWERGWRRWTKSRFLLAGNHVACRRSHGCSFVGRNYSSLPPSYSILWKDHRFSDKTFLNFL